MRAGIDLDGTISDILTNGLIPLVAEKYGITLTYNEISEWRYPIGDSYTGREINRAFGKYPDFTLSARVVPGTHTLIRSLRRAGYEIVLITARNSKTQELTEQWLANNNIYYDELIFSRTGSKSVHATDILVDDYHHNIIEYVDNVPYGIGVLIEQPWNRLNHDEVSNNPRVKIAKKLTDIPNLVL